jgi:hypothetical protein
MRTRRAGQADARQVAGEGLVVELVQHVVARVAGRVVRDEAQPPAAITSPSCRRALVFRHGQGTSPQALHVLAVDAHALASRRDGSIRCGAPT